MAARNEHRNATWVHYLMIALLAEKVFQHVVVTAAFYLDWKGIRATVAVNPTALMILGGVAAILFGVALWAILSGRKWAARLVIAMALFDILGEFVAQGTIGIEITVSFLVAVILLVLALLYRRPALRTG